MSKAYDYEKTYKLKHHEAPAKINLRTGDVVNLSIDHKKPVNGMIEYDLMKTYTRMNTIAWNLLTTQTTPAELEVAVKLATMAKAYTNSLVPLNDEMTATAIAETLKLNRKTILKHVDKLFKLGVIGKWEVYEEYEVHKKYWVFNPYLSFNGKVMNEEIPTLFDKTTYARVSK